MIVIIIVRRAVCEVCRKTWDLEWGEDPPTTCKLCGSRDWEEGPEARDAIYIRKGISTSKRKLNPGASSRARQEQGKRQWRKFRSKEQEQVEAAKKKAEN